MSTPQNQISTEIPPRIVSIGGPEVYRFLPYAKKRMVGPFIYFDYFPATDFKAGDGLNVPPHPHIGLSTLSYLIEGEVLHHDSLGCRQVLRPGDVNWMTAGKGIAHSERLPETLFNKDHRLHLLQFWVALPINEEDREPSFEHHPAATIPQFSIEGAKVTLVAGSAFDYTSPVKVFSEMFFMDVQLNKNKEFVFSPGSQELAFFLLKGSVEVDSQQYIHGNFVVLDKGSSLKMKASTNAQIIVLGGEPFSEQRIIFWNFVSSSKEKIETAKRSWSSGDFPQVPGESDTLQMPADKPKN